MSSSSPKALMVQARRTFADGIIDPLQLSRIYNVSPALINTWISTYDFEGYAERREQLNIEAETESALSQDDEITTAVNLLKKQLSFAAREGDINFTNVQEVKTFVETVHLLEGKPTAIIQSLDEKLSKKQISQLVGDEAVTLAMQILEDKRLQAN